MDGGKVQVTVDIVAPGGAQKANAALGEVGKGVARINKETRDQQKQTEKVIKDSIKAIADFDVLEEKLKTQKKKAIANEFLSTLKKVESENKAAASSSSSAWSSAFKGGFLGGFVGSLTTQLYQIPAALKGALDESIKIAAERQNALKGLESIAVFKGINGDDAQKAVMNLRLVKAGIVEVGEATTGLKNLLATGFSLPEAIKLMEGFSDTAAFGKQAALGYGEAIRGATEGIKNQMSQLVDNAGVTKNLSVILKEAGKSEKDLMNVTTDASVRAALYNGLLKEMTGQTGDADKLTQTYTGSTAALDMAYQNLQATIGSYIIQNPQMLEANKLLTEQIVGYTKEVNTANSATQRFTENSIGAYAKFKVSVIGTLGSILNTFGGVITGLATGLGGLLTGIAAPFDLVATAIDKAVEYAINRLGDLNNWMVDKKAEGGIWSWLLPAGTKVGEFTSGREPFAWTKELARATDNLAKTSMGMFSRAESLQQEAFKASQKVDVAGDPFFRNPWAKDQKTPGGATSPSSPTGIATEIQKLKQQITELHTLEAMATGKELDNVHKQILRREKQIKYLQAGVSSEVATAALSGGGGSGKTAAQKTKELVAEIETASKNPNVQAFFSALSTIEGGGIATVFGGAQANPRDPRHPGAYGMGAMGPKGRSTAAGLYQETYTNWKANAKLLGLSDFTDPQQQLKLAIYLFQQASGGTGLSQLLAGNFAGAAKSGTQPWAASPFSTLPGRKRSDFLNLVSKNLTTGPTGPASFDDEQKRLQSQQDLEIAENADHQRFEADWAGRIAKQKQANRERLEAIQDQQIAEHDEHESWEHDWAARIKAQKEADPLKQAQKEFEALMRSNVADEAHVRALQERNDLIRQNLDLEEEIMNVGVNAAERYRRAWLEATLDVRDATIRANEDIIKANVQLDDARVAHSEQAKAKILGHLAEQKTQTELLADVFISAFDRMADGMDKAFDKAKIGKIPIIGDFVKGQARAQLTQLYRGVVDKIFPGASDNLEKTQNPALYEAKQHTKLLEQIARNTGGLPVGYNPTVGKGAGGLFSGGAGMILHNNAGGAFLGNVLGSGSAGGNGVSTGNANDVLQGGLGNVFVGDQRSGGGGMFGNLKSIFAPQKNPITGKMNSGLAGKLGGIGSLVSMAGSLVPGRFGRVLSGAGTGMQIGSMFGPWGAAIGAGVGALFGLFGHRDDGAKKLKEAALSTYGVDIKSKSVIQQLVAIGEGSFGKGNVGAHATEIVSSEDGQQIIRNYAESTGQSTGQIDKLHYADPNWSGNNFSQKFSGFGGSSYSSSQGRASMFVPTTNGSVFPTTSQTSTTSGSPTGLDRELMAGLAESIYQLKDQVATLSSQPEGVIVRRGLEQDPDAAGDAYQRTLDNNPRRPEGLARSRGEFQ